MTLYYDVIVIGGGHAGCEAACAAARMGARTCLVTMDMNKIAQMSCNPAIGGIAKGQIVREIDALGGQTGLVTDATTLQFRMLNVGKGPAVWSPRAQCDRGKFIWRWRETLDATDNLDIWQDQVCELITESSELSERELSEHSEPSEFSEREISEPSEHSEFSKKEPSELSENSLPRVTGVRTIWGCELRARCVIVTAGTFLNGLMHIGRKMVPGGRIAEPAATGLTESITRHGIRAGRMKTGTPVRIDRRSVDFALLTRQDGEQRPYGFSYLSSLNTAARLAPAPCWMTSTNEAVHAILRSGLPDSPLYNGQISSIGPRYCPSIETKLVTFAERDSHPLFLEPEGENTNEMYLNGFSSSLPMDVQLRALHEIPAFRDVRIYRPGYAIEYDYFDPTQLRHTLESKLVSGLFFAGQVNGTTGYEEAAGQGLIAGINAAIVAGAAAASATEATAAKPFTLARDEAYIGVLIDDLVTKGVDEPYRMFTSRAEYRILLRQDDADRRLTERSHAAGLASTERLNHWLSKKERIEEIERFCENYAIHPRLVNPFLEQLGTTPLQYGCKLADLIARPQLNFQNLLPAIPELRALVATITDRQEETVEAAEIRIKYRGYIERERQVAEKMHRLEDIRIPASFRYADIQSLSTEARQKLSAIQPTSLAQASRIPGVSPSDINVLLVLMGR